MTRGLRTLALVAVTSMGVGADASAQAASPSAYCLSASAGFMRNMAQGFAELKKCQRGDTIVIPAASAGAVAQVCDFSKAIVQAGGFIACMLEGSRRPER